MRPSVVGGGRVVVTGAGGFIGSAVVRAFIADQRACEGWLRTAPAQALGASQRVMGSLAAASDEALCHALDGAGAVVHLAGRAHVTGPLDAAADDAFRRDNVEATERLARAVRRTGVPRFVHVSTVKVNGDASLPGRPFRPSDTPSPDDAYGRSKWAAEKVLQGELARSRTRVTVLRLPLVYGPGARGNFAALVRAVAARRILPLGSIRNRRHMLGLSSLIAALEAVLDAPAAVGGTHFVCDALPVSTPELVRAIAAALGVQARLLPVPVPALRLTARLLGRMGAIERLTGSLEVDPGSLVSTTGWLPRPFFLDADSVRSFEGEQRTRLV